MTIFQRLFSKLEVPVFVSSDPLDHPDVQRMTLRELADLPLPHTNGLQECGSMSGATRTGPAVLRLGAFASFALVLLAMAASAEADSSSQPRGQYLAAIMDCGGCHTPGALTGAPDAARTLAGGDVGFQIPGLGTFWPPNLTPDPETGLGAWSAEDIMRAVRTGVRPDGRILAPAMPYHAYSALTDADAAALAKYLKSLAPIRNAVPALAGPDAAPAAPYMAVTVPK